VWKLADAVHDCKIQIRVVLGSRFDLWRLRESDTDDQVVSALCKGTHRRLNRGRIAAFNIPQHDWQVFGSATDSLPGSRIKRAVVLATDIKDDTNMNLGFVIRRARARSSTTCQGKHDQNEAQRAFHCAPIVLQLDTKF